MYIFYPPTLISYRNKYYWDAAAAPDVIWSECPIQHQPLDIDDISMEMIAPVPTHCSDTAAYIQITNNSDYYIQGTYEIEKRVGDVWMSWRCNPGREITGEFYQKIDSLFVPPHSKETVDIPFEDTATGYGFLPIHEPGEYRMIWTGNVWTEDTQVERGALFAYFTLE